jgi:hypothetical protein
MSDENEDQSQDPLAEPSRAIRAHNPEELAERVGILYKEGEFQLKMMRWEIGISYPELEFKAPKFLDTYVIKVLALIYIAKAMAQPLANHWVPYRELKDGLFYTKTFSETVEDRLCRRFCEDIESLQLACEALGGREVDQGDLGMVLKTFPRLPLLIIVWQGDEEFEPNARILFDASATSYFNAFELRMLCGEITSRLIRIADVGLVAT